MEEKKNKQPYIIPPAYKKLLSVNNTSTVNEEINAVTNETIPAKENTSTEQVTEETDTQKKTAIPPTAPPKKSLLESRGNRVSGLSLNSIRKKKEIIENRVEKIIDPNNLPREPFTQEQMQMAWHEYGAKQDKKGEKIVGSMFAMNIPTLDKTTICLELPNESMKIDMEAAQSGLLQYMYHEMSNFDIDMKITVNEQISKKHAFTPLDKYEKLREKNPLIDKLRKIFDLDI